ncbi:MAG: YhjD/YihY/BrkB family envelope integrity protein, partial [Methylobacter sp.]
VAFAVYFFALNTETTEMARTYAFTVLVFAELLRAFGARSETKPVWRISLFTNINLTLVVVISVSLQVWSQHNATLGRFLKTSYLTFSACFVLVALGAIPLLALELTKVVQRARLQTRTEPETYKQRLDQKSSRAWTLFGLAVKKFSQTDGAQSAAAFAHYAFFSLFPLIVLIVTIASAFIDRDLAGTKVIAYVETYVPMTGEMQSYIFDTINDVIKVRGQAGAVAFLLLIWAAMGFFATLVRAANRAWSIEVSNWWRRPFKSLGFLIIMISPVLLAAAVPVLAKMAKDRLFPVHDFSSWVYALGSFFIPLLVVFLGLSLFYRLAPRRPTRFAEIWFGALCATALLLAAGTLFVVCLENFATLNAIYGAFGGIMALLLWIYLSGCILIFGACLCAAQAEALNTRNKP